MQSVTDLLKSAPLLIVLASIGAVLLAHFVVQYVIRGLRLRRELIRMGRQVKQIDKGAPEKIKQALTDVFKGTRLEFAWTEYEETLHEQFALEGSERRIASVRATVPAESFINLDSIVDSWIGSEYFKHVPGILTGLGIIGTFYGLIQGLISFHPEEFQSEAIKNGLRDLFGHVREAFTFSGFAIGSAMGVTVLEKWLYASCTKWIGSLTQSLDGLFRAGVGEEYLSKLVRASQDGATQVRQLKEAMVEDLKALLTDLSRQQIVATQQLSTDLGNRIREGLQEPLAELTRTVRETSNRQADAGGAVLEQLMTSFLAQMREAVGGQIGDLSGLMQQTAQSMGQVELAIRSLVADMQQAGKDSSSGVQEAVRDLMRHLAEHQQQQADSVKSTTNEVLQQLQQSVKHIAVLHGSSLKSANEGVSATMSATRDTIDKLSNVSSEMIDKLQSGAAAVAAAVGNLNVTADGISELANGVTAMGRETRQSTQAMTQASQQLALASQGLGTAVGQLGTAATRLEGVAKSAAIETDARARLLQDLQAVMSKSQEAAAEFSKLAEEVRSTLETSIDRFGTGVSKALSEHLREYDKQLGDAVGMLKGAMQELAEYASKDED